MQISEIGAYVARQGWDPVEYAENESTRKRRPVLERMMADAKARKLDIVCVYKLDRFGRSVQELVENIAALDRANVRFISITQGIDTDQRNPASRFFLQILAAVAEFERSLITERINSGIAEARKKGVTFGRPKLTFDRQKLRDLIDSGVSYGAAAEMLGISKSLAFKEGREQPALERT